MSIFSLTFSLFLIMNAIGNIPLFISLLGRYDAKKQRTIILRELLIALLILLIFCFFGDNVLSLIGITQPILGMAGGIILFIIGIGMIFPKKNDTLEMRRQEPFVVPLAMPIVAGPGAITTVMIYSEQLQNEWLMSGIILMAWIPSFLILWTSSNICYVLGQKGLNAVQKFGGMLICLMAVQMLSSGTIELVKQSFNLK